jgi:tetratricopeptide (TPR) repeat protein
MATFSEALSAAASHRQSGNLPAAEQLCRQMIAADPRRAAAHYLLGCVLKDQRRFADALLSFHQAVTHEPQLAEAWFESGTIYHGAARSRKEAPARKRDIEAAEQAYRAAINARPDYVEAWSNLGAVYRFDGRPADAIACYRRVIELRPDFVAAHNNLGVALVTLDRFEEALASYEHASRLDPGDGETRKNRSLALLTIGRFAEAWPEYEYRWKCSDSLAPHIVPQWDGSPLEGRTLLVHFEQGLGDSIQFVRYVQLLQARGDRVVLETMSPLVSLFKQSGIANVVAEGQPLPPYDLRIPLMSLMGVFKTDFENMPRDVPYLSADPGLVAQWRDKLPGADKFKVAIAWQCSVLNAGDLFRSIPLASFAPVANMPGVQLVSIQKQFGLEQIPQVAGDWPLAEVSQQLTDFHQTAALLKNVDLIITCDTAVAHLGGALGVPTWVGLPKSADWRWFLNRDDSPWYPTVRLFRQSTLGDWSDVFQRITAALAPLVHAKSASPLPSEHGAT